jgi:hypothetical protein
MDIVKIIAAVKELVILRAKYVNVRKIILELIARYKYQRWMEVILKFVTNWEIAQLIALKIAQVI